MKKQGLWSVIQKHMMTGIGYMIPIIMAPNLLNGFALLIGNMMGVNVGDPVALESANVLIAFLAWIAQVGYPVCQNLMYPVFAGFLAYSIGDRQALSVGFFGGVLAANGKSGFIGALAAGFLAGYLMKFLVEKISVSRTWKTTFNFMIYPLLGSIVLFIANFFIIDPFGGWFTATMTNIITAVGSAGEVVLQAVLGAGMAVDCGGPINKATLGIAITLNSSGANVIGMMFGTMIAPLAFAFAVLIDKFILKRGYFNETLQGQGISSLVLGLFNVTEGALPLVLEDPLWMVIINGVGSAIGGVLGYLSGNFYNFARTGNVLGYLIQDNPVTYVAALWGAALITACMILARRAALKKQGKLDEIEEVEE